ncbi:MAG TPA: AhpC/TSA family protein [Terriglobales bacterium]|nr:AhpC/TSA family protein [Terriglobales bacterium]
MAAMAEISKKRSEIAATGTQLAFVHMGTEAQAQKFFSKFSLNGEHQVSDPQQKLYKTFSLSRGKLSQLFGLRVWKRGFRDRIMLTYGVGRVIGDSFQLPGVFLVHHSEILKAFRHETVADEVDYLAMAR